MTEKLRAPPLFSTPDSHIFEDPTPPIAPSQCFTDDEIKDVYEIQRTVKEIRAGKWRKIALQFPDGILRDAPKVFQFLEAALAKQDVDSGKEGLRRRLCILADTSYGACCVDEVAAEHVQADVVVHYGRSCLSPTARLPVIYVFACRPLQPEPVIAAFEETFPERDSKVVVTADICYSEHVPSLYQKLKSRGYSKIFAPSIIHDPSSLIPNRTLPPQVTTGQEDLKDYSLFHISDPPASLLLTLSSRLKSMYIYPTMESSTAAPFSLKVQTSQQLRRRYALLTSLTTCSIFGILVNTLSVKNYLHTITKIQAQLAAAGKKSYIFVVGKINAAKVANFSEIGGWVVVGCWESSLIESTGFYKPIITPFELQLALMSDEERIWTGEWTCDISSIVEEVPRKWPEQNKEALLDRGEVDDEEESAPPEFDLRTGRYVSHSRPMRPSNIQLSSNREQNTSAALAKRANVDLATINGTASPGAEYLRSQRTWQGLGSDFEVAYERERGAAVEQGRGGVARGYTLDEGNERR